MQPLFRSAKPDDVAAALIYSAGPGPFEYGFTQGNRDARQFLNFAFAHGKGFFGWRNHTVAILNDKVVGVGAFYSGREYNRLSLETTLQIIRNYLPISALHVIRRSLQLSALMPRPARSTHYIANLGVNPDFQGLGIGTAMLNHQKQVALELGRHTMALDVSVENPRGQALYERLGFNVTAEQSFPGRKDDVANSRRMELPL